VGTYLAYFEILSCYFNMISHYFSIISLYFDIISCYFNIMSCYFNIISWGGVFRHNKGTIYIKLSYNGFLWEENA